MKKHTKEQILALILSILMIIGMMPMNIFAVGETSSPQSAVWNGTAASGFESGTGTEADPYIIKTAEQLKYFANQVNGGNKFEERFKNKYIKLDADIVLNDTTDWENWDTTARQILGLR